MPDPAAGAARPAPAPRQPDDIASPSRRTRAVRASRVATWLLAALAVLVYTAPEILDAPAGDAEMVATGYRTLDQLFYFACARRAAEEGLAGLFYANPNAFAPEAPRCYSQLFFVLTGWLWRLTGATFPQIDFTLRLVFGVLFLGLAAECFLWRFAGKRWLGPLIFLLFFGGGGAWILATLYTFGMWLGPLAGNMHFDRLDAWLWLVNWHTQFQYYEGLYGTWGMNLFRRLAASQQVFYHTIFYAGWLCVLRGRWRGAAVAAALLWWAHPFTAVDFAIPFAAAAALHALFGLDRGRGWKRWAPPAAALALLAAGLAYYMAWLPFIDPLHDQVEHQMRAHGHFLAESKLLPALGVLALTPILLLRRRLPWRQLPVLANLSLLVSVLALTFHHRILGLFGLGSYQPLHFEQGYLYFSLLFLAAEIFTRGETRPAAPPPKPATPRRRRWRTVLLTLAFLSLLPDNPVYYATRVVPDATSRFYSATWREWQLIQRLAEIPGRRRILIYSLGGGYHLGALASVETPHHFALGHPINCPDFHKRVQDSFRYYSTGDLGPWLVHRPELVIVAPGRLEMFRAVAEPRCRYRLLDEVRGYRIYEINPDDSAGAQEE